MFNAGALVFKIQSLGRAAAEQDLKAAGDAFDKTGKSANDAAGKIDKTGTATENTGKKAKAAKAPLEDQAKATDEVGKKSEDAGKKQQSQAVSTEKQIETAKKLSAALTIAGVAVAAMVTLSVAKWVDFDQQMSNTSAAVMANAQEQRDLAEAALEAGADTAFSAREAAAAQEELAKAGQSVSQIVGGSLNGALALAAAGQLQVARSAEIMATALTQFGLEGDDAAHVADVLAAGAGKAQGSVDDLALALGYVGPLAKSAGWDIEETAGTIAYFATQGIIGEKAGTALRGVLAGLQAPSTAAARVMGEYGINVYDASGKMLSAAGIAEQLKTKLRGLTDQERQAALGRIFGNESLLAATLLYEGGAQAVNEWTDAVDDSGYAAEQAAMRQDNLAGDVEKLGGAFDTALIRTGSGANDVLREMVQSVTALVDWYGELPAPIQGTALVLGIATGAMLLFSGAAVGLKAKFIELKAQMDASNASIARTALVGAAAGLALAGVVAIVSLLAQRHAEGRARAESYANAIGQGEKAVRELAKTNLAAKESFLFWEFDSGYEAAEKLGISLELVTDAALGNVSAMQELDKQLDAAADGSLGAEQAVTRVTEAVKGEAESYEEAMEAAKRKQKVDEGAGDAAREHEDALAALAGQAVSTSTDIEGLADAIMNFGAAELDTRDASRKFEAALDDVGEKLQRQRDAYAEANGSLDGFVASLDTGTDAGRENESALDAIAEKSKVLAAAIVTQTGSQEDATAAVQRGRDELIRALEQFGITGDAAEEYADRLGLIPEQVVTAVQLNGTEKAISALDTMLSRLGALTDKTITVTQYNRMVQTREPGWGVLDPAKLEQADGGIVKFFANGGTHRENHVAQFARAGTYRVWAEDETGGEAYIPLAAAKRARSTQVLSEVANQFGYSLVPAGGLTAGTGAVSAPAAAGDVNINVHALPEPTAREVVDLMTAELRWLGR
ncbi:phage tail tape measure protein [Microbacterium caowuchunii]|uniref:Phage tail tape measure protein n=1 Tax=Microbacterium caowuchunii TaxID=2614638 RepID=A0A5N0TF72_9MICO|nr:phage tail tape measure protein [Microbacterium caowuchunii]KAA9133715.1 phage tail tape measure protein [Microbacterium caowuchunii]